MNSIMQYKGYDARIRFSDKDDIFYGKVLGIKDSITFHGESVSELKSAFKEAVDDYIIFSEEIGEKPEKPYKGAFNVRVSEKDHRDLTLIAIEQGESLNAVVVKACQEYVTNYNNQMFVTGKWQVYNQYSVVVPNERWKRGDIVMEKAVEGDDYKC